MWQFWKNVKELDPGMPILIEKNGGSKYQKKILDYRNVKAVR